MKYWSFGPRFLVSILLPALVLPNGWEKGPEQAEFELDFEKYTLANGLEVVLHEDRSDPVVAVSACYHVGSNREVPGKRGLAHLVEHMMFQGTQNVPPGARRRIGQEGGWQTGATTEDVTIFVYTVPRNALEFALWLEADRMGFLEPAMTRAALERQQQLVINEIRQQGRTSPYAFTGWMLRELLYPEDHPYHRGTGGSIEDISLATLENVLDYHGRWYGPNNATLVVAGDIDVARTKGWIEKYFGEMESGATPADPQPRPVTLDSVKRAYRVDDLASAPELTLWIPTVEQYHQDWYALHYLAELLSARGNAPFPEVIVKEQRLAPSVSVSQSDGEIAGTFEIRIRAFDGVDLDDVQAAVEESFRRFEAESFNNDDLEAIRARSKTDFFVRRYFHDVWGKAERLALLNELAGSPGFLSQDLVNRTSVTRQDVLRVYEEYIRNKPYVMTSFVPKGAEDLTVAGSEIVAPTDEPVKLLTAGAEPAIEDMVVRPVPSSFDRTIQPPIGPFPQVTLPAIWKDTLSNGLRLFGIENHETPLVRFSLTFEGGQWSEGLARAGSATLLAKLMMEGTKRKTSAELQESIDRLGATLSMNVGRESISMQGTCLASHLGDVTALVREIVLEPRWDEAAFARIKEDALEAINRENADPTTMARTVFDRFVWGEDHIFSLPTGGNAESVGGITLDDLKAYHDRNISPSVAYLAVVGDLSREDAIGTFVILEEGWQRKEVVFPEYPSPSQREDPAVYFVDVPGLSQSVIRIGGPAMPVTDRDYYPATVRNEALDGMLWLLSGRGYAYPGSVRSRFKGLLHAGTFEAEAQVRSDATLESLQIFRDVMFQWRDEVPRPILEGTTRSLANSIAVNFEELEYKLSMLDDIALYGFPDDFVKQREDFVRNVAVEDYQSLARTVVDPDRMVYVVVGDAASQFDRLRELGLGEPVLVKMK